MEENRANTFDALNDKVNRDVLNKDIRNEESFNATQLLEATTDAVLSVVEKENIIDQEEEPDKKTVAVDDGGTPIKVNIQQDIYESSKKMEGQGGNDIVIEICKVHDDNSHDNSPTGNDERHEEQTTKINTNNFFQREWKSFREAKQVKFSDKKKISSEMNFRGMKMEWISKGNENHWSNKKVKKEGEMCSDFCLSIFIGLIFIVCPNCAIVLDYNAAYEYLFGTYYIKRRYPLDLYVEKYKGNDCRHSPSGDLECLETDPIWGILSVALTFIPGIFWSLGIFIQLGTFLRKEYPDYFQRSMMIIFFFIPVALLSIVTFPFQLVIVSIIACFNTQDQWMLLTTKIGIAEGMFNAHLQYMLQLFIFFTRADRYPSLFQYLSAFGSLLFLVWSRIESLLLDRGGHNMGPGQKARWILRFGPVYLIMSAYKVASISLVISLLRYNSVWLYGGCFVGWVIIQILFNERCLPKRYYYLFIGAGLHAVSVAHIPDTIKIIDTHINCRDNILWSTRLTYKQIHLNLLFQNVLWFIFNLTIIGSLLAVSSLYPKIEIPIFWPFNIGTCALDDNKIFDILLPISLVILILGLISVVLAGTLARHEEKNSVEKKVPKFEGWIHDPDTCQGCLKGEEWHEHQADKDLQDGVQGTLGHIIAPLANVWQNFVDKNTA